MATSDFEQLNGVGHAPRDLEPTVEKIIDRPTIMMTMIRLRDADGDVNVGAGDHLVVDGTTVRTPGDGQTFGAAQQAVDVGDLECGRVRREACQVHLRHTGAVLHGWRQTVLKCPREPTVQESFNDPR